MMLIEQWKPVVGFEDTYEVSSFGDVRRISDGAIKLQTLHKSSGYLVVHLSGHGKSVTRKVHQLVLEAFVGPRPPKHGARHFPDARKTNNKLANLQWSTQRSNMGDVNRRGQRNPNSKLNPRAVRELRALRTGGATLASIATKFGISVSHASHICSRKYWG